MTIIATLKWVFGFGAFFLLAFNGLCVNFFGVDIKNARNELRAIMDESRKIRDDARADQETTREKLADMLKDSTDMFARLKSDYADQQDLARKLRGELADSLRDARSLIDKLRMVTNAADEVGSALQELEESKAEASPLSEMPAKAEPQTDVAKKNRIREIIQTSKFEWTTIGRIMKGTGLSHSEVTELQGMPEIRISRGRKTQDIICKFKQAPV